MGFTSFRSFVLWKAECGIKFVNGEECDSVWKKSVSSSSGSVYIDIEPNFVTAVPADVLAPNSARPSAGSVLMHWSYSSLTLSHWYILIITQHTLMVLCNLRLWVNINSSWNGQTCFCEGSTWGGRGCVFSDLQFQKYYLTV